MARCGHGGRRIFLLGLLSRYRPGPRWKWCNHLLDSWGLRCRLGVLRVLAGRQDRITSIALLLRGRGLREGLRHVLLLLLWSASVCQVLLWSDWVLLLRLRQMGHLLYRHEGRGVRRSRAHVGSRVGHGDGLYSGVLLFGSWWARAVSGSG